MVPVTNLLKQGYRRRATIMNFENFCDRLGPVS